jgi:hypothetical protein
MRAVVAVEKPDIILITETWCNEEIGNGELAIDGYQLETECRRDRTDTTNGIGGGLLTYTKTGLAIRTIRKFDDNKFNQFCAFKLLTTNPINIILVYRPPNSGNANTDELCKIIDNADGDTILIGDFNFPEIKWQTNTTTARSQAMLDTLEAKQMQQLIHFPTHVKGNILDLIITNSSDRVVNIEEGGRLGRSDHFIINVTVAAEKPAATAGAPRYDWSRANIRNIRDELRAKEWQMDNETSIEDDWQEFKDAILATTMKNVPVFKTRTNMRPKWLSREIMKLIRQKKSNVEGS